MRYDETNRDRCARLCIAAAQVYHCFSELRRCMQSSVESGESKLVIRSVCDVCHTMDHTEDIRRYESNSFTACFGRCRSCSRHRSLQSFFFLFVVRRKRITFLLAFLAWKPEGLQADTMRRPQCRASDKDAL